MTFEELKRYSPKMEYLPPENGVQLYETTFWEDLYQLFKARMIAEQEAGKDTSHDAE